jgi:uncharacterized protein (TIGR02453 family)
MPRYDLKGVLDFLSELAVNNSRPWFEEHRTAFEKARSTFEGLVDELIRDISAFDDLSGLTAKDCVLRIHRDIRFSRDKTPYKTAMVAAIMAGGRKSGRAGYGLHMAPNETMAAGGFWEPEPEQLAMFRRAISRDPRTFLDIVEAPGFVRLFGNVRGEKLKSAPQGYAKDHPAIEILKLKQVYVARAFTDEAVIATGFVDQISATFRTMRPFVDYLNAGVR